MPVIQGNYKKLMKYYNEIEQLKQHDSVLLHTKKQWFADFNKMNNHTVIKIRKAFTDLDKEYFEHEEKDGRIIFAFEGEGKDRQPKLKEGKDKKEHSDKVEQLYNQGCGIWV